MSTRRPSAQPNAKRRARRALIAGLGAGAALWVAPLRAMPPGSEATTRLREVMDKARTPPAAALTPEQQAERMRERAALLEHGEAALARVDVAAALQAFERAASYLHAADSEMGLVRTYMQGGEYRRAVSFVAHTAGAHREVAGGAALYAWLLNLGGHGPHAQRLLDEALRRFPADPVLPVVRSQLASGALPNDDALLRAPARLAPYAQDADIPPHARSLATGVLFDDGRRALAPIAASKGVRHWWVRNALGEVERATVEGQMPGAELAWLTLARPLSTLAPLAVAPTDAFPGSIAYAVEYPAARNMIPRWPLLTGGFLGGPLDRGQRALGVSVAVGPRGGPVFDAAGRLVGIVVPPAPGAAKDRVILASFLRAALPDGLGDRLGVPSAAASGSRMPADEIYELTMRSTLDIIGAA